MGVQHHLPCARSTPENNFKSDHGQHDKAEAKSYRSRAYLSKQQLRHHLKLTTCQVTDAREAPFKRPAAVQRQNTRLISVDNVLQYASEIPSGQRRGPPRPVIAARTESGRHPLNPKLGGGAGRTVQSHIPQRSSKVSEKLVLLPEADIADDEEEKSEFDEDSEAAPPRDDFEQRRRKPTGLKEKSYAERLPKASRTERLSRVTAYCTAQSYRMKATAAFVREKHGAKTKLYDDCLYTVYHLPLISGTEGFRIRSSPVLKSPGGKALLDEEIERNERQDYSEGYFGGDDYRVQYNADSEDTRREEDHSEDETHGQEAVNEPDDEGRDRDQEEEVPSDREDRDRRRTGQDSTSSDSNRRASSTQQSSHDTSTASSFAEMFIFSYGVVVFWNFTLRQEKDILADLAFSSSHGAIPLAVRPQLEEDFETEQFHFEYNHAIPRPRVFNDMITLRSRDHMIKLSMSHAIAQSTKLSFFEERMADTMEEAQYVPRRLALRGELGMKREEVVRILGRLFMSRVDVNLCESRCFRPSAPGGAYWRTQLFSFTGAADFSHLSKKSFQYARRAKLLLGERAHAAPAVRRRARVPGNQAAHTGAQRALPRLPRPRRDPQRLDCRPQNVSYVVS